MNIAIVGGTGTVGAEAVRELAARGHDVRVLSRHAPEYPVDLRTGAGLARALAASSRVDAAQGDRGVLVDGTARLLRGGRAACAITSASRSSASTASAGATTAPSSPGGRDPALGVPWTIVRATQFHTLVARTFAVSAKLGWCRPCGCRCSRSIRARSGACWPTPPRRGRRGRSRHSRGRRSLSVCELATRGGARPARARSRTAAGSRALAPAVALVEHRQRALVRGARGIMILGQAKQMPVARPRRAMRGPARLDHAHPLVLRGLAETSAAPDRAGRATGARGRGAGCQCADVSSTRASRHARCDERDVVDGRRHARS